MKKLSMFIAAGLVLISTNALARTSCRIEMPLPGIFLPVCEDVRREVRLPVYRGGDRYYYRHHNKYNRRHHDRNRHHRHDQYDRHRRPQFDNDRFDRPYHGRRW